MVGRYPYFHYADDSDARLYQASDHEAVAGSGMGTAGYELARTGALVRQLL